MEVVVPMMVEVSRVVGVDDGRKGIDSAVAAAAVVAVLGQERRHEGVRLGFVVVVADVVDVDIDGHVDRHSLVVHSLLAVAVDAAAVVMNFHGCVAAADVSQSTPSSASGQCCRPPMILIPLFVSVLVVPAFLLCRPQPSSPPLPPLPPHQQC